MTATYYSRSNEANTPDKVYCELLFASAYQDAADFIGIDNGAGSQVYLTTDGSNLSVPGLANGDIVQLCYKQSTGDLWIGVNNSWIGGGDPSAETTPTFSGLSGLYYVFSQANIINTPQSVVMQPSSASWTYAAPTGASSWNGA